MTKGVNKVILIGNLGADPEVRYMPSGDAVANVSIATGETWKDRDTGEPRERTEWHRVVFFGKLAEIVGEYLHKGSKVYVEGKLRTRKWQGQDEQDRYTTEVVVDFNGTMQMLDSRSGDSKPSAEGSEESSGTSNGKSKGSRKPSGTPNGKSRGSRKPSGMPKGKPEDDDEIPF